MDFPDLQIRFGSNPLEHRQGPLLPSDRQQNNVCHSSKCGWRCPQHLLDDEKPAVWRHGVGEVAEN